MISRPQLQLGMIGLATFGILFNNVLRWYPFPPGRSANDLTTLEDNLLGIGVNLSVYAGILALTFLDGKAFEIPISSVLLYLYCLFIGVQSTLRPEPLMELARSLAIVSMILSADRLAVLLSSDPDFLGRFMKSIWVALVGSVALGVLIGLLKSDSVNWGADRSPSFVQTVRAEFFFFHLLPYPTVALSLVQLSGPKGWRGLKGAVAVAALGLVFGLSFMTMTRSIVFSCVLVALVFLFDRSRRSFLLILPAAALVAYLLPEYTRELATRSRLYADSDVDLTTHRAALVALNLRMFAESPLVGLGAQESRRRIQESESVAKTEHGYTIHLSSYGAFASLFIGYVLLSLAVSSSVIWSRRLPTGFAPDALPLVLASAACAIATAILGLVWLFGSGTAFYDWMGFLLLSLAACLGWRARRPRSLTRRRGPEIPPAVRPHRLDAANSAL